MYYLINIALPLLVVLATFVIVWVVAYAIRHAKEIKRDLENLDEEDWWF